VSEDPPQPEAQFQLVTNLMDAAPVGAAVLDLELRYRWINRALSDMHGHSAAKHWGRTPSAVMGPIGAEAETLMRAAIDGNRPIVNQRFNGTERERTGYWIGSYFPLHDAEGGVIGVGVTVADVSDYERVSARERQFLNGLVRVSQVVARSTESDEVLSVVAEEAAAVLGMDGAAVACFRPDGVALEGRWGEVAEISGPGEVLPAATTPLTELVRRTGRPQRLTSDEPDALGFRSRVAAPILVQGVLWGAVKAGSAQAKELPADAEAQLARFAELVGLALANAAAQRELIEQASHDPLTGLCNRRAFQERLETEAQRARRHRGGFSLVLLDIDNFKAINDMHGHPIGDAVLIGIAAKLSEEVRKEDLLARIGGEEFGLILPSITGVDALMAAERARQLISLSRFEPAGRVTLSAGVATFDEALGIDTLFQQADRALYEAKRRGRDRTVSQSELAAGASPEPVVSVRQAQEAAFSLRAGPRRLP
jgi:diguanylate cyclase (GGDEF)-like protein